MIAPQTDAPVSSTAMLRPSQRPERPEADLVALMGRMARGDAAAVEAFYLATVAHVFGMALRVTARRELAAIVTEEAYVQLWQSAPLYRPDHGSPLPWVLSLCHGLALAARPTPPGAAR